MVICPRCKSNVDGLEPIPASALPEDGDGGTATAEQRARACSRCVHEILEG